MANEVNYSPLKYMGNGSTAEFLFSWKIFNATDINVVVENVTTGAQTTKTYGTDYTVDFGENGGYITFNTAPTSDYYVIIGRNVSDYQSTRYSTSPGFQGSEIEKSFDKLSCNIQELEYSLDRAVKVPLGSSELDLSLPLPDAHKVLKWNSAETGLENSTIDADTLESMANRLYQSADNIDTVAESISDVNDLADIKNDVVAVSGIKNDISTVANNDANITIIATDLALDSSSEIKKVNANKTNIDAVADELTNIDTVKNDLTNIDTVATDLALDDDSEIKKVNANKTNIDTVAGDITNVNAVGNDISNVNDVADDLTNINTLAINIADINAVADDFINIDAVAGSISNVNVIAADLTDDNSKIIAVNTNKTNIDAVANNSTNINAVAGNSTNINAVAGNATNINAVAGNSTNINAVAGNATNINAVNSNKTNIDTVAGGITNIETCATNISDINDVADDLTNITAVKNDLTNIDTAVTNIEDINTVAENIEDIAEKQNVITIKDMMLKASVLSSMNIIGENNEGRTYTEPKTYAKMLAAAHSTFDANKFTKVGSPAVTSDGIASGFSGVNCFTISSISITASKSWTFKVKFKTTDVSSRLQPLLFYNSYNRIFISTDGRINIFANGDASSTEANTITFFTTGTITTNINYLLEINFNGTNSYTAKLTNLDSNTYVTGTNTFTYSLPSGVLQYTIGSDSSRYFSGTIDFKQYNITVDGVEIFSGNKTGIDTIKADDYTVVGSPTISADGIASGFTTSNYLTKASAFTIGSDGIFSIDFKVNWTQSSAIQYIFDAYIDNQKEIIIRRNANGGVINLLVFSGGTAILNQAITPANPDNIVGSFGYNGTYYYWIINGITYGGGTQTKPAAGTYNLSLGVRTASGTNMDALTTGDFDLNAFKIYIDGDLVYQPCLKIPYKLAAKDKKFIDIAFNNRAKDMAKQFGAAPYTIIDESNRAFILPYGSVDSKVAPKILVDSGEGWEQFLDRTMVQRGTMTADIPVTFPCSDEYANTDYSLSCPYSAKSKTGFTPTVSGEYIAVGKV